MSACTVLILTLIVILHIPVGWARYPPSLWETLHGLPYCTWADFSPVNPGVRKLPVLLYFSVVKTQFRSWLLTASPRIRWMIDYANSVGLGESLKFSWWIEWWEWVKREQILDLPIDTRIAPGPPRWQHNIPMNILNSLAGNFCHFHHFCLFPPVSAVYQCVFLPHAGVKWVRVALCPKEKYCKHANVPHFKLCGQNILLLPQWLKAAWFLKSELVLL